jgi:hypothetical protein
MPGRRLLIAFVALSAAPLLGCLHISAPSAPTTQTTKTDESAKITARAADTQQPPRLEFAVLPKVPGTVVPTKTATSANVTSVPLANTVQKPIDPLRHAGGEPPGPFPVMQSAPLPEAPLLAAVRAYTEGRPERAIEIIRTLDKQNQDLVLALLPILARGASADLNNDPATVAALVEQLHTAATRLEPRAALRVEKVAFCKHVGGFGRFVPWPDNQPYRPYEQAQLYLEVRNLGSQPVGNEFMTQVQATIEVRDAYGKVVEQIDKDDVRRRVPVVQYDKQLKSQSPLNDFHMLYIFSAPPAPGVYTITVELRDAAGRRTVKTPPAQFCVAGP